jgi:hypothetical protein
MLDSIVGRRRSGFRASIEISADAYRCGKLKQERAGVVVHSVAHLVRRRPSLRRFLTQESRRRSRQKNSGERATTHPGEKALTVSRSRTACQLSVAGRLPVCADPVKHELRQRLLYFATLNRMTWSVLIREDLARSDPTADLIRAVGPRGGPSNGRIINAASEKRGLFSAASRDRSRMTRIQASSQTPVCVFCDNALSQPECSQSTGGMPLPAARN